MDRFDSWPKPIKPKKDALTLNPTSTIVHASSRVPPNSDLYFIPGPLKNRGAPSLTLDATHNLTTLDHHINTHDHTGRTMATAALNQRWEQKRTITGQTGANYKRQIEDQMRLISDLRLEISFYRAIERVRAKIDGKFKEAMGEFETDLKSEITKVEDAYLDNLCIPRSRF
jgi:hypothetical protein